jgi:hypothetical protein
MLLGELQAEVVVEIVKRRMLAPKLGRESIYRRSDHDLSLPRLPLLAILEQAGR